jgi:hypothetical protein
MLPFSSESSAFIAADADTFGPHRPTPSAVTTANSTTDNPHLDDVDIPSKSDVEDAGLPEEQTYHRAAFEYTSRSNTALVLAPENLGPGSPSQEYFQPRLEANSVNAPDDVDEPPPIRAGDDLTSRLKEYAGLELALVSFLLRSNGVKLIVQLKTIVFAVVTWNVHCSAQDHRQACHTLGFLLPIFLPVHIGGALAACGILFIPQNGGNVPSRCLRLICEYIDY